MKRDLHTWKKTNKRGQQIQKEGILLRARGEKSFTKKRDLHIWKETYINEKRPTCMKRECLVASDRWTVIYKKKRPTRIKGGLHVWK